MVFAYIANDLTDEIDVGKVLNRYNIVVVEKDKCFLKVLL